MIEVGVSVAPCVFPIPAAKYNLQRLLTKPGRWIRAIQYPQSIMKFNGSITNLETMKPSGPFADPFGGDSGLDL